MALLNGPGELVSLDWRSRMEFYARQIAGGGGVGGGGATEATLLSTLATLATTDANNLAITQSTADAIILALSYIENKSTTYSSLANQNSLQEQQYLDSIQSIAANTRFEVQDVRAAVNQQGSNAAANTSAQTFDLVARLTSIDGEISSTGSNVATRVETVVGSVDTSVNNVRTIVEDLRLQVLKLQEERQCAFHTRETLKASDYLEVNSSIFNYPSEPLRYRVRISNNTGDGERPDFRGFGFVIISPTLGYSISRNEWDQSVGPGESILLDVPSAGFQLTVLSTDPGGVTGNIQVSGYYSS